MTMKTSVGVNVRMATLLDVEPIADIISGHRYSSVLRPTLNPVDGVTSQVKDWLTHSRRRVCTATISGQVVGFLAAELGTYGFSDGVRINRIHHLVCKPTPNQSTARALIRFARSKSAEAGVETMAVFQSSRHDASLVKFMESCNYSWVGTQCFRPALQRYSGFVSNRIDVSNPRPDDETRVLSLSREFFGETQYAGRVNFQTRRAQEQFARFLVDRSGYAFVARRGGEPIGFIAGHEFNPIGTTLRVLRNSYLYVHPRERDGHAAKGLLAYFNRAAISHNLDGTIISASSGISTARMQKFFLVLGYEVVGSIFTEKGPVSGA